MKYFVLIFAIFAVILSAAALKTEICGLPHSDNTRGVCRAAIPSWSYKSATNECVKFNYNGCGGNENRFETKKQCEETCKE